MDVVYLIEGVKKKIRVSKVHRLLLDFNMPNFETMRALQWKLNQVHTKASPKTFLHHLNNNNNTNTSSPSILSKHPSKGVWTQDIVLYTLFLVVVVVFVYIVMSYAKEFGT